MQTTQKTYSPKASEVTHAWRLVDAEGQTLGRLATQIATYLRGKHLPTFAEHLDMGDFVVVVNASRIHLTGNKAQQRMYYRHSTYPGADSNRSPWVRSWPDIPSVSSNTPFAACCPTTPSGERCCAS